MAGFGAPIGYAGVEAVLNYLLGLLTKGWSVRQIVARASAKASQRRVRRQPFGSASPTMPRNCFSVFD